MKKKLKLVKDEIKDMFVVICGYIGLGNGMI